MIEQPTPVDEIAAEGRGPLSHLRVLDLTQFLSGPFATQILGDLGAEIIKVEAPGGDMTRGLPPHFVGEESAYYLSVNRNKRSIVLDLKSADGKAALRKMALASDIVIENFRPGVLERLGLSYLEISKLKPEIIWCSLSGFGQDGPYRNRPAYDMIVQAQSGGMSITGEPTGRPVRSGIPMGDVGAGLYAVIGVLAAQAQRAIDGKGNYIDVAMLDCQIALLCYQAAYHLASGVVPERQGTGHDSIPTYRSFNSGDGNYFVMTANTERMWRNLCEVIGKPELAEDSRFRTNEDRYRSRQELWEILEDVFLRRSAEEWVDLLIAAEIPAAVVNTLDRSLADPQVLHRGMVLEMTDQHGATASVPGNPIKLSRNALAKHSYPPRLDGDGIAILQSVLGLSAQEAEEFLKSQRSSAAKPQPRASA